MTCEVVDFRPTCAALRGVTRGKELRFNLTVPGNQTASVFTAILNGPTGTTWNAAIGPLTYSAATDKTTVPIVFTSAATDDLLLGNGVWEAEQDGQPVAAGPVSSRADTA